MSYDYQKQYGIKKLKEPWFIHFHCIQARCSIKNKYYKYYGIKNFLKLEDIKYLWFKDKAYELVRPSIDRINPDGHYILDNCRFIEYSLNSSMGRKGKKWSNDYKKEQSKRLKKYFKTHSAWNKGLHIWIKKGMKKELVNA